MCFHELASSAGAAAAAAGAVDGAARGPRSCQAEGGANAIVLAACGGRAAAEGPCALLCAADQSQARPECRAGRSGRAGPPHDLAVQLCSAPFEGGAAPCPSRSAATISMEPQQQNQQPAEQQLSSAPVSGRGPAPAARTTALSAAGRAPRPIRAAAVATCSPAAATPLPQAPAAPLQQQQPQQPPALQPGPAPPGAAEAATAAGRLNLNPGAFVDDLHNAVGGQGGDGSGLPLGRTDACTPRASPACAATNCLLSPPLVRPQVHFYCKEGFDALEAGLRQQHPTLTHEELTAYREVRPCVGGGQSCMGSHWVVVTWSAMCKLRFQCFQCRRMAQGWLRHLPGAAGRGGAGAGCAARGGRTAAGGVGWAAVAESVCVYAEGVCCAMACLYAWVAAAACPCCLPAHPHLCFRRSLRHMRWRRACTCPLACWPTRCGDECQS